MSTPKAAPFPREIKAAQKLLDELAAGRQKIKTLNAKVTLLERRATTAERQLSAANKAAKKK